MLSSLYIYILMQTDFRSFGMAGIFVLHGQDEKDRGRRQGFGDMGSL